MVIKVVRGYDSFVALRRTGEVVFWGSTFAWFDVQYSDVQHRLHNVTHIASGDDCVAALLETGEVIVWEELTKQYRDVANELYDIQNISESSTSPGEIEATRLDGETFLF